MTIKVSGINGSLSSDAITRKVLEVALDGAREEGCETSLIDLRETALPFCDGRADASTYPPPVQTFRKEMRSSQGIILCTPEYHNSFSGILKNALDLLGKEELEGKMFGLIGVAGGSMGANAVNQLRIVCRAVGAWVVPHHVALGDSERIFNGEGLIGDVRTQKRLKQLGQDVGKYARLHFAND